MKYLKLTPILLFLVIVSACGTINKTTISDSADLSKYSYATITDVEGYGGSPILMDLSVRIYDALSKTRLTVIGDKQIETLSLPQKQELLLVRYTATQNDAESVVSINFVEYLSGRPVASFRGAYGLGFGVEQDMNRAINNAIEQMKKHF